jgi:hypothetical protein
MNKDRANDEMLNEFMIVLYELMFKIIHFCKQWPNATEPFKFCVQNYDKNY